jgi:hypothetical protein
MVLRASSMLNMVIFAEKSTFFEVFSIYSVKRL